MRVLQLAGLMAPPVMGEPAVWIGGNATLVQMGDVLDRGDDEIGAERAVASASGLFLGPYHFTPVLAVLMMRHVSRTAPIFVLRCVRPCPRLAC